MCHHSLEFFHRQQIESNNRDQQNNPALQRHKGMVELDDLDYD